MEDLSKLSIIELAALICDTLKKAGLQVTLSGGACAEIYSKSKYVTGDLDFVTNYSWPGNDTIIENVMLSLGFKRSGRIYINRTIAYSVEFPPGPLSIGEQYQIKPTELKLSKGDLLLLSPTDSVKDRLTGYFYGNDAQCLEQAVMICQMNEVEMDEIRTWAEKEDRPSKFMEFEKRIVKQTKKNKRT